jgi:hypothetical protein
VYHIIAVSVFGNEWSGEAGGSIFERENSFVFSDVDLRASQDIP